MAWIEGEIVLTPSQLGDFSIQLKGNRNYIHSTDVWNAITRLALDAGAPPANAMIIFRKLTSKRLRLVPFEQSDRARRFAEIRISTSMLALDEGDGEVIERVPCPESRIVPLVRLQTAAASIASPSFASPVEAIVAATKTLHLGRVDLGVKWLVGRLDLPMPLPIDPGDEIEVRIARRLPRLTTVSDILRGEFRLGSIMFNPMRQ